MSLESKIEDLTQAVIALTAKLQHVEQPRVEAVVHAPLPQPVAAPVPVTQVNPAPLQPTVVAMPAPPTFTPPAPVVATSTSLPFDDMRGLTSYVMKAYMDMGPQKGAQIQTVLTTLGYQNINDVKPEHYRVLFDAVEALKK